MSIDFRNIKDVPDRNMVTIKDVFDGYSIYQKNSIEKYRNLWLKCYNVLVGKG